MPNFLRLVDRETNEAHENRGLIAVDEKLCAALNVPVDDVTFYLGWVDWLILYLTEDWAKVREQAMEYKFNPDYLAKRLAVIDWLEANYSLNSYAQIGRR